jgi:hypothetical protein
MEQSTNTFRYRPLQISPQEFRLVLIQPGPFSSPISCTLQHAFLKDSPSFEALSYVWGDAQDTLPIFLDGHIFNVTTNLECALRHLRLQDKARAFWIDAICIDQLNLKERGYQVDFMGEFYRAAGRTTIWLGPEEEHTALAFEYMLEREELDHNINIMLQLTECLRKKEYFLEEKKRIIREDTGMPQEDIRIVSGGVIDSKDVAALNGSASPLKKQTDGDLAGLEAVAKRLILEEKSSKIRLAELWQELERGGSSHARALCITSPADLQLASTLKRQPQAVPDRDSVLLEVAEISTHILERAEDGLVEILERPWWDRVWVIQEIARSRNVVFQSGNASASLNSMYATVKHSPDEVMGALHHKALAVLQAWNKPGNMGNNTHEQKLDLLDYLQGFRHCEATDPRDKVYALVSLAADISPGTFRIDYTLTTEELYKGVVRFILFHHKSLDILGAVIQKESEVVLRLPSWAPDWSLRTEYEFPESPFLRKLISGYPNQKFYNASGGTSVSVYTSFNIDHLVLKGFVFDTLVDLCDDAVDLLGRINTSDFRTPQQHLTIIQQWEQKALEISGDGDPYSHTGRLEAFWRTLIADAIGDKRATKDAAEMFKVWSGRAAAPEDEKYFTEAFVKSIHRASNIRKFCVTSKGYMVLAPSGAVAGDLVCILLGGQTPFILRFGNAQFHLFVGACYVHGIMDGEAMQELHAGKYQLQDFVIQ